MESGGWLLSLLHQRSDLRHGSLGRLPGTQAPSEIRSNASAGETLSRRAANQPCTRLCKFRIRAGSAKPQDLAQIFNESRAARKARRNSRFNIWNTTVGGRTRPRQGCYQDLTFRWRPASDRSLRCRAQGTGIAKRDLSLCCRTPRIGVVASGYHSGSAQEESWQPVVVCRCCLPRSDDCGVSTHSLEIPVSACLPRHSSRGRTSLPDLLSDRDLARTRALLYNCLCRFAMGETAGDRWGKRIDSLCCWGGPSPSQRARGPSDEINLEVRT